MNKNTFLTTLTLTVIIDKIQIMEYEWKVGKTYSSIGFDKS